MPRCSPRRKAPHGRRPWQSLTAPSLGSENLSRLPLSAPGAGRFWLETVIVPGPTDGTGRPVLTLRLLIRSAIMTARPSLSIAVSRRLSRYRRRWGSEVRLLRPYRAHSLPHRTPLPGRQARAVHFPEPFSSAIFADSCRHYNGFTNFTTLFAKRFPKIDRLP